MAAISAGHIRREDFLFFDPPAPLGEIVCSWDLAASTGSSSSYSACLTLQRNGNYSYLIDAHRGRHEYGMLKRIAIQRHDTYAPTLHLIEDASLGRALAADLKEYGANVLLMPTGNASKFDRFMAQIDKIKGQRILLPRQASWLDTFLDELVSFPHGSRDDQVDALTQYLKWLIDKPAAPPKAVSRGIGRSNFRNPRVQDMWDRANPMPLPSPAGGRRRRRCGYR